MFLCLSISQIPDTKCTVEEHNYEVLKTGNQSKGKPRDLQVSVAFI